MLVLQAIKDSQTIAAGFDNDDQRAQRAVIALRQASLAVHPTSMAIRSSAYHHNVQTKSLVPEAPPCLPQPSLAGRIRVAVILSIRDRRLEGIIGPYTSTRVRWLTNREVESEPRDDRAQLRAR
jgi:hypothetical protein